MIFARAPRLGRVKSRLAKELGPIEALRAHRLLSMHVIGRLARTPRWQSWLWVTPEPARWPRGIPRRIQSRGDLGQRMAAALRMLPAGPAVIVGTDIPDLDVGHVARAFAALERHQAVFGPAEDGGYWLVGLRHRAQLPHLFDGVRWSSEFALADTLANLGSGKSYVLVDRLPDVDDAASLARWKHSGSQLPMRALN